MSQSVVGQMSALKFVIVQSYYRMQFKMLYSKVVPPRSLKLIAKYCTDVI